MQVVIQYGSLGMCTNYVYKFNIYKELVESWSWQG